MKHIDLINFTEPIENSYFQKDRFYHIYLGNGHHSQFKNRTNILAFIAQTKRELNKALHQLNFIYIEVFIMYRHSWPYIKKHLIQQEIADNLNEADKGFNMLVTRSNWTNGNHFVFSHLFGIIASLKRCIEIIISIQKKRGITVGIYQGESLKVRLNYLHETIVKYPALPEIIKENINEQASLIAV